MNAVAKWSLVILGIIIILPLFLFVFRVVSFVFRVGISLVLTLFIVYLILRAVGVIRKD